MGKEGKIAGRDGEEKGYEKNQKNSLLPLARGKRKKNIDDTRFHSSALPFSLLCASQHSGLSWEL